MMGNIDNEGEMPEITLKDAEGFHAWANMAINNKETWFVSDANALINFFGEGDAIYLVLECKTKPDFTLQYVFLPKNEEDENHVLAFVFDFLRHCNYSFLELQVWLQNAPYETDEMGDFINWKNLRIKRNGLTKT
ncbi:MAG: hypothetical protein RL748_3963 [Pseudomonadota bacterium]|jgi:hypothetical protein